MYMKKIGLVFILLSIFKSSLGCGNEYGYTLNGSRVHTRYFYLSKSMLSFDKTAINKRLKSLNLEVKI